MQRLSEHLDRDDARIAAVRADVADLNRELDEMEAAAAAGQMKQHRLEEKSAALEEEYRRLMELYIELGK